MTFCFYVLFCRTMNGFTPHVIQIKITNTNNKALFFIKFYHQTLQKTNSFLSFCERKPGHKSIYFFFVAHTHTLLKLNKKKQE